MQEGALEQHVGDSAAAEPPPLQGRGHKAAAGVHLGASEQLPCVCLWVNLAGVDGQRLGTRLSLIVPAGQDAWMERGAIAKTLALMGEGWDSLHSKPCRPQSSPCGRCQWGSLWHQQARTGRAVQVPDWLPVARHEDREPAARVLKGLELWGRRVQRVELARTGPS